MIGPIKAYKIVCEKLGEDCFVRSCMENDNYYVFILSDDEDNPFVGRERFIVNKKTGKYYSSDDDDAPKISPRDLNLKPIDNNIFKLVN